jgi:16S rRNA (cytidine1402-2'-O)-methyltransferase
LKGTLYLIPTPLGDTDLTQVIPDGVADITKRLRVFIVEEIRTARRFLRKTDPSFPLDDSTFHILNEHTRRAELEEMLSDIMNGTDTGLISEAGLPCIADPGSTIVAIAHSRGIRVIPLSGPSSIILGLIASGMNGQRFTFNGYLPVKPADREKSIRELELMSKDGDTQIFMETPYRNLKMFADLLRICKGSTKLCIAAGITTEQQYILTLTITAWRELSPPIDKIPAVFILSAGSSGAK